MDPTLRNSLILVLVWLLAATAAAHVDPPTDVKLRCQNLHNVLTWSYDRPSTGLRFQVDYCSDQSCHEPIWVDPPNLKADLPVFSDPSYDYFVTVTAVIGQNMSEAAPPDGIRFSYFKNSQEEKKCFVEFPAVNVTAQPDGFVLFRFIHPWLLYNQRLPASLQSKSRQKRNHYAQFEENEELPTFSYDVVIVHQKERHHDYICEESVCEEKLSVDDTQEKHCLKMKGELEKISVRAIRDYCIQDIPPHKQMSNINIYIYVIISVVVFIVFALILFMVYKKKTKASSPLPNSVNNISVAKHWPFHMVQEQVDFAEPEPASPTPLLAETEELQPTFSPSTESDITLCITVPAEDEGVCVEETRSEEGPGYMGGRDFDEEDVDSEPSSGYEKRDKVVVNLAPNEQTEGYRG